MSRVKILNLILLCLFVCSCTAFDAYIDRRRNPGTGDISKLYTGKSLPDAPAVCYNPLLTTDEEIQKLADEECVRRQTGTHAEFVKTDKFSCKLLLPYTSFYTCIK